VGRGDGSNALREAFLPSDALEKGQGLTVGGDSVRRLALHLAAQEVEVDEAGQVLMLLDCRLGRHLCVTWCNVPGTRTWTLSFGQEVKSTGAESGRYWERIDVLARGYGQPGAESPKESRAPDLVAGLAEGERELLLAVLSGAPEEPTVGGMAGGRFGGAPI